MNTYIKKSGVVLLSLCVLFSIGTLQAQKGKKEKDVNYSNLEEKQNKIESLTLKIFDYYEDYPNFTYAYNYNSQGDLESITIKGVSDVKDKSQLEDYLRNLATLRSDIENLANRVNIYYVTETAPKPKDGYEKFYDEVYTRVDYPERAVENGIEGKVYVRFIVDDDGEILHTNAVHDIESNNKYLVSEMVEEAKQAVKSTSGNWIPGKVGNIAVTNWMMIPVEYDIEQNPATIRPIF